jgi:uncharacterized protein (TIGR02231 family)
MRLLPVVFCLMPVAGMADVFTLSSRISDVTVYPNGAKVVREAAFSVPDGTHSLRLLDLPQSAYLDMVRASATNVVMGAVTVRGNYVPPRDADEPEAVSAARQVLADAEKALEARRDDAAALRSAAEAAEVQIGFLRQLGQSAATEGAGVGALRDIARMVGEETFSARQAAVQAEAEARAVDRDIADLTKAVATAQQALDALVPSGEGRNLVDVAVASDTGVEGVLRVTYFIGDADWRPVNDAFLTLAGTPALALQRGAMVRQASGENWDGVALSLSTSQPSGQIGASDLGAELRRIYEPARPSNRMAEAAKDAAPPSPEPVIMADASMSNLAGLIFTYAAPAPVSVASGADGLRISLGTLNFTPDIRAVAVPYWDGTAYLTAEFVNTSEELLLPSDATHLYLEGEFVGTTQGAKLAAGQEASLPFGPIEGLRLTRVTRQSEGDRGIISKTNQMDIDARILVENLTGREWPMRVVDRVPYSQQDDLIITWTAQPIPTTTDAKDQPGVLEWEFNLSAGQSKQITLTQRLQWPMDQLLR